MPQVIQLQGAPASTAAQSGRNISAMLDIAGKREMVRQNKQQVNAFVAESIRLQGENPNLNADEITQLATKNVLAKGPQFDPGLAGGFQRIGQNIAGGPSTALTGPTAERAFNEPTGIRRELIKQQIESSKALATQRGNIRPELNRVRKTVESNTKAATKEDIDPVDFAKILEEQTALLESTPDAFFDLGQVPEEDLAPKFEERIKKFSDLKANVPGKIHDKQNAKAVYEAMIADARERAIINGINPDTAVAEVNKWWDKEATKTTLGFREFQPRTEFMDIETAVDDTPNEGTFIDAALEDGTLTQAEFDSIVKGLQAEPHKVEDVRALIERKRNAK